MLQTKEMKYSKCSWCNQEKSNGAFPKQPGIKICFSCRENPPKKRKCSLCGHAKPTEEFEQGRGRNQCKDCRRCLHQERINQRSHSQWECTQCNQTKPAGEFHAGRRVCKDCANGALRDRRRDDTDWAEKLREQKRRAYEGQGFRVNKNQNLKSRYNITIDQYDGLSTAGNGVCWICRQPETAKKPRSRYVDSLHVDHIHDSGVIRGLLCGKCNTGIGHFNHDIKIMEAAIRYLEHGNRGRRRTMDDSEKEAKI